MYVVVCGNNKPGDGVVHVYHGRAARQHMPLPTLQPTHTKTQVVDQTAPPVPSLDLAAVRPKMVHFVGARKPAMACVFQGLLEGGLSGGYDILNALPDLEEEYAGIAAKLGKTAFDPYSESVVVWGADVDGIQDGMTRQDGSSVSSMTSESDLAGMIDSE